MGVGLGHSLSAGVCDLLCVGVALVMLMVLHGGGGGVAWAWHGAYVFILRTAEELAQSLFDLLVMVLLSLSAVRLLGALTVVVTYCM